MTPEQKVLTKWVLIYLFLVGVFFFGFAVRGYIANHQETVAKLEQQESINATLNQYANDLLGLAKRNQALQNKISSIDDKHTQVMNEKLAENSALRRDLAVAQRMRLQGTTCPKASPGSDVAHSPGMDDGAGVELSAETRLAVWDLRESIIRDQAKLAYLQEERRALTCKPQVEKNPGD